MSRAGGVAAGAALAPPSELIYMLPAAPPVVAKATCPCPPWAASARAASDPQVNQGVAGTGWDYWEGTQRQDQKAGSCGGKHSGGSYPGCLVPSTWWNWGLLQRLGNWQYDL